MLILSIMRAKAPIFRTTAKGQFGSSPQPVKALEEFGFIGLRILALKVLD